MLRAMFKAHGKLPPGRRSGFTVLAVTLILINSGTCAISLGPVVMEEGRDA